MRLHIVEDSVFDVVDPESHSFNELSLALRLAQIRMVEDKRYLHINILAFELGVSLELHSEGKPIVEDQPLICMP